MPCLAIRSRGAFAAVLAFSLAAPVVVPLAARAAAPASGTEQFVATMGGGSEVPRNDSNGSGVMHATLDLQTGALTYTVTFHGLTGPATMAHIHGPAPVGSNAEVQVPLGNDPVSPIKGHATLTAEQVTEFEQGKMYVNVHTKKHPGGEIRGQLMKGV